jgi:hypothetical protein
MDPSRASVCLAAALPHNKFIVRLEDNKTPVEVWTGSTNFTPSGFLGQTNVGHRVQDADTAQQYLDYWEVLKNDPELDDFRKEVLKLTPDPAALIKEKSIVRVFSPRAKANLLEWYGDRMIDGASSVMFTAAFGVAKQLVPAIAKKRNLLRFILMEKPATEALQAHGSRTRLRAPISWPRGKRPKRPRWGRPVLTRGRRFLTRHGRLLVAIHTPQVAIALAGGVRLFGSA